MRLQDSGGRLINCRVEKVEGAGRSSYRYVRTAGLRKHTEATGRAHCRGFIYIGSTLIMALDERVVKVTEAAGVYTVTDLGALAGSGPVRFARNNKRPTPDIVAVADGYVFNIFTDSAPTAFADVDLPSPVDVTFGDGVFFWPVGDGRVFSSGINAVTVDALDFATAESRPGGLLRGWIFGQNLFLQGPDNTEVWTNAGNPTGFPYTRSTVIRIGLAAASAVAGYEDEFGGVPMWVGSDLRVYKLSGLSVEAVSTNDVERAIGGVEDKNDLEAVVYMEDGHPIWSLTGPAFSWEYDFQNGSWIERQSYLSKRWRASQTVKAFGQWLAGDRETGELHQITRSVYKEGAHPLIWEVESGQVADYPSRFVVPRTDFDFVTGVGNAEGEDPIETNPQVEVSWTDDGGYFWHLPRLLPLGRQAKTVRVPPLLMTGRTGAQGRRYRLTVSDPVPVIFLGGAMAIQ